MMIDQARKGGFRFRAVDELAENKGNKRDIEDEVDGDHKSAASTIPEIKKAEEEYIEAL